MNRREILKSSALLLGYTIVGGTAISVMDGCKADTGPNWEPLFFSRDEIQTIDAIADRIIPETQTPGASQALVHRYIDLSMVNNHTPEEQTTFKTTLTDIQTNIQNNSGKLFQELSIEEQDKLIGLLANSDKDSPEFKFFKKIKELTVVGYFSSEVGAKQALIFEPNPGPYKGCIPFEEVRGVYAL